MGPGSHCKPSVFRSIPNALALRSSLAGRACPVHTGRGVSQRGGQAQAPHVPLFAFSPARLFSRATRQTRLAGFGSDRRAYTDVLPDAVCISACSFWCFGWHCYTLLLCELCAARRKTRTPCSNRIAATRLQIASKVSVCVANGHFAYLQFTEVLVFSMIWILFYDT
jgi:hypothetical protein